MGPQVQLKFQLFHLSVGKSFQNSVSTSRRQQETIKPVSPRHEYYCTCTRNESTLSKYKKMAHWNFDVTFLISACAILFSCKMSFLTKITKLFLCFLQILIWQHLSSQRKLVMEFFQKEKSCQITKWYTNYLCTFISESICKTMLYEESKSSQEMCRQKNCSYSYYKII